PKNATAFANASSNTSASGPPRPSLRNTESLSLFPAASGIHPPALCSFAQLAAPANVLIQMSPRYTFVGDGGITMSLKITSSEVEGVSLVALNGRIVLGEESTALREKLKNLNAAGKQKIVLNMAEIDYIDSSGLGALVAAHLSAK